MQISKFGKGKLYEIERAYFNSIRGKEDQDTVPYKDVSNYELESRGYTADCGTINCKDCMFFYKNSGLGYEKVCASISCFPDRKRLLLNWDRERRESKGWLKKTFTK